MEEVKVLLVDDDVEFAETLGKLLADRGVATATAASGDEGLEKSEQEDFDVILLDLRMPGKDGIQTLREVKARQPLTEVIMLSGQGSEEAAIEGMRCGAFDFLAKPPDPEDLLEKIHDAHVRKVAHLHRIRQASEAGEPGAGPAERAEAGAQPAEEGASSQGRLLVFGRHSHFSEALIEYALDMAERLSYEVLAASAGGFSTQTFRTFPRARERACLEFRVHAERDIAPFRSAAKERDVPFSHVVKFSGLDEAAQEIRHEVGEVDFVVHEPEDEQIGHSGEPEILVYSPT